MNASQRMEESMRTNAFTRLKDHNELIPEAIFDYLTSIAETAAQGRYLIKQIRFMPRDEPSRIEAVKLAASMLDQVEKHYEDSFGIKPSWNMLRQPHLATINPEGRK